MRFRHTVALVIIAALSLPATAADTRTRPPEAKRPTGIQRFLNRVKQGPLRIKRNEPGQCNCNEFGQCSIEQAYPSPPLPVQQC